MKSKSIILFNLFVVLVLALSACGTQTPAESVANSQAEKIDQVLKSQKWAEFSAAYVAFDINYSTGVHLEEGLSEQGKVVWENTNAFLVSAGEQSRTIKQCFSLTEDFVLGAASAVFAGDPTNPATPAQEADAIVKQLAINVNALSVESLYAGDPVECQRQLTDFVAWSRIERKELVHEREVLADQLAGYDEWRRNNFKDAVANAFMTEYGPYITEIITDLGTDGVNMINNLAQKAGSDAVALPLTGDQLDFLGLPTGALWYVTNDKSACDAALAIYNADLTDPAEMAWAMEQTGGLPVELYKARWSSVAESCTLYRQAAWEMLMKPIFSVETNVRQACGVDAGFDQEIDPETCKPIEPTPANP